MVSTFWIYLALLAPQEPEGAPVPAAAPKPTVDQQVASEAAAIQAAVALWCQEQAKVKLLDSSDGRLLLWSDFSSGDAREASKRSVGLLARMDRAFGAPEDPAAAQLTGVMLRNAEAYHELCDLVAATAPAQQAFMESSKSTTGFTLYAPPLTVYFHDAAVQKEARPDHSIAHSFVHLEMWRRYGALPLWLTEGLACAGEDGAWGEVWAYWYREGFVFAKSHSDWRGKPTQEIVAGAEDLRTLFDYPARPFEHERALLSFAFATYCLDAEPEAFAQFVQLLSKAYQENNPQGGRPVLPPEEVEKLLNTAFPEGFLGRFQTWWKKPPRWNARRAA